MARAINVSIIDFAYLFPVGIYRAFERDFPDCGVEPQRQF